MVDYAEFHKSLRHLELQYANFATLSQRTDLGNLEKEAIAESVIHRFETCYDSLWKVLKRYLNEELGIPDVPNSPKPIIQLAYDNEVITDDIARWKQYANARIATSHDYSGAKAEEALVMMGDFIRDAGKLYRKMTGDTWEQGTLSI